MFPDLRLPPTAVYFATDASTLPFAAFLDDPQKSIWEAGGIRLSLIRSEESCFSIIVESQQPIRQIVVRWNQPFPTGTRLLGDAWERSYGELEWRGFTPHRLMPWYFLASLEGTTAGYGIETGAASLACWQADTTGLTLTLDVRSGGAGVSLGSRALLAAKVTQRLPIAGESPFAAARAFCAALCPHHLTPSQPIVGHNDWYWLYGKNSASAILEATRRFVELYPSDSQILPWSVIDDGWQTLAGADLVSNGGPWINQNPAFPDMPELARNIKELGARPGIWMRPLHAKQELPPSWGTRCPLAQKFRGGVSLDPSIPEVLELVHEDISRLRSWGFEMIKHDFSTYDVTGLWGMEMKGPMGFAPDGWTFADNHKTTAEILTKLYETIRRAAGPDVLLIGCNVVGHLAAGLVEIQRIGDDTSATDWNRTRQMGVNTLAFRSVQQGTFFAADADCVPVSPHIPDSLTVQWLDLVARSGTPLFLSMDPAGCNSAMKENIRHALAAAVRPSSPAEPLDWLDSAVPSHWRLQEAEARYDWNEWVTPLG